MSISKMILYSSSLVAIIAGIAGMVTYGSFSHLEESISKAESWQTHLDQLRVTILITCFSIFLIALICGQFIARFLNKTISDLSQLANGTDGEMEGKSRGRQNLDGLAEALRQSQIIAQQKEQMEVLNKELQLKNDSLDSLVYRVSHDLKAPIINIQSLLKIIKNRIEPKNSLVDQSLGMAEKATVRLQTTIVDLLEVARIEKRLKEGEEWLSISGIISDVISDNQRQIKQWGTIFDINLGAADQLYFSKNNLSSILANLITNAIKYASPEREAMVKIYANKEGDTTILTIEDNGIGMDLKKHQDHLFQMFKRFHDHVEGTGVGMYIVKKLMEDNNGSILLESELNVGTKLTLYFQQPAENSLTTESIMLSESTT